MPSIETHTGLLRQTIPNYNKRTFVNISNKNQFYTAFPAIVKNTKAAMSNGIEMMNFGLPKETSSAGGTDFRFNVQVGSANTFSWVGMHDPVNIVEEDYQVQATVLSRMCRTQWSYNKREMAACRGEQELTNLITTRSLGCDQDFADSFEAWFWNAPPASTDTKTAWPLRYWLFTAPEAVGTAYTGYTTINVASTDTHQNFLALNHNSYTSGPGGISRVTYPMWGNANVQYTTFNDADFVEKLQNLVMDTHFVSPVGYPNIVSETPDRAFYTTKANKIIQARLARQQNDANGSDIAGRMQDNDLFRIPTFWVPQFDRTDQFSLYSSDNQDVFYGIDWSTWRWASTKGFTLQDEILEPSLEAPLDYTHLRYLDGNLVCFEPRRNFVMSK